MLLLPKSFYNVYGINNNVRLISMSDEKYDNIDVDDDSGWFSKPSIEYVIKPKEKKGIVDNIDDFFRFLF